MTPYHILTPSPADAPEQQAGDLSFSLPTHQESCFLLLLGFFLCGGFFGCNFPLNGGFSLLTLGRCLNRDRAQNGFWSKAPWEKIQFVL